MATLNAFAAARPMQTAMVVMGVKAACADALVQHSFEGAETLDSERVAVFTTFGVLYQGVFQYQIWNRMIECVHLGLPASPP